MYPLCLAPFTWHNIFKVHQCCSTYQYVIPSYDWQHSIVWMYHTLFILSSADGQLGFHFLAIWTILAWIFMQFLGRYLFSIPLGIHRPRSGITGSYANSMFKFLRKCRTVAKEAVPVSILTSNVWHFQFLTSSQILVSVHFIIMAILVAVKYNLIAV